MLFNYDDAGVLLTEKTKDEVLRKFKQYSECDFVKAGQTPKDTLMFQKDECLTLPPRSDARNLYLKLKELGMPIKLSGGVIKLTDTCCVCEAGVLVTENATKILKLLHKKMFNYVFVPLCCWSASTGETEYFRLDLPKRR
ncbi:mRNA turnover protein 4 homolog [Papaver somniferum]|uniref:mRNA turnover protein 4 homolog n=1 Tax=Papaver somniferum TaxID=3469 RepID=UPI000E702290|nr:mRNA turnover protein 4 homolog [Papaver somniferum]